MPHTVISCQALLQCASTRECRIITVTAQKEAGTRLSPRPCEYHKILTRGEFYPTSSRIAFFTFVGTGAYFSGSMTDDARPWLIERSSVV